MSKGRKGHTPSFKCQMALEAVKSRVAMAEVYTFVDMRWQWPLVRPCTMPTGGRL